MSQIVVNFNFPHLTAEQYNHILAETEPLRKASYPGLLFHVAAPNGKGMFVCDIWESEAHFNAFGAVMLPVLAKVGGTPAPPSILPMHHSINELAEGKRNHP
jgi:hypothetical protein